MATKFHVLVSACVSGGGTLFTSNGFCYVASIERTPWFNARNICLFNGGDLATFPDLNSTSHYLNGTQYWIGLSSSSWKWQNAGKGFNTKFQTCKAYTCTLR